jgi:hypothetical protein
VISQYAELLAAKLRFDRSLSQCVRQEVEDHLREAVAADPAGDTLAAQQRAIANFGDAQSIAAEIAIASLAKQTRTLGVAVILVIAGVFIAMKARIAWYAATQWALSGDMKAVGGFISSIDFYAFWLSVIIGVGGWAYISNRPTPSTFNPSCRVRLRRCFLLCAVAAGALIAAVLSDGVLTVLRLFETELSVSFLVPIFSMAGEITCAGILVSRLRAMTRRTAYIAALLGA